jgi:hypothetical protein
MEPAAEETRPMEGAGLRFVRLSRAGAGLAAGDLLLVRPGAVPEGGEIVIDLHGRVGRHGGGPVWGVVVGAIRSGRAAEPARRPGRKERATGSGRRCAAAD